MTRIRRHPAHSPALHLQARISIFVCPSSIVQPNLHRFRLPFYNWAVYGSALSEGRNMCCTTWPISPLYCSLFRILEGNVFVVQGERVHRGRAYGPILVVQGAPRGRKNLGSLSFPGNCTAVARPETLEAVSSACIDAMPGPTRARGRIPCLGTPHRETSSPAGRERGRRRHERRSTYSGAGPLGQLQPHLPERDFPPAPPEFELCTSGAFIRLTLQPKDLRVRNADFGVNWGDSGGPS